MCPSGCLAGMMVLWVAALVPKPENGARIWYKPIHLNPAGLPVGAVGVRGIRKRCQWIAPVHVYPGEVEQEEMCYEVLKVLTGEKEASRYTGQPVFSGYAWDR